MQQKTFRFGPIALTGTLTTNLLNPPTASGGVNGGSSGQRITIKHLRVVNATTSAATVSLYLGATGANAAGTEIEKATVVPANSVLERNFNPGLVLDTTDFLVGGASAGSTLTISGEGEIGVA